MKNAAEFHVIISLIVVMAMLMTPNRLFRDNTNIDNLSINIIAKNQTGRK